MLKHFEKLGRQRELYDAMLFRHKGQQIRFLPNGKCPFLSDNNLCNIQLQFGWEYMADICNMYPRRIFSSPRGLEFSLSLSCATAVHTLIQPKITIERLHHEPHDQQNKAFYFIPPRTLEEYSPASAPLGSLRRHYYHVEDLLLKLMQNRDYSLNQRLIALGRVIELSVNYHNGDGENLTHSLHVALKNSDLTNIKANIRGNLQQLHFVINSYLTRSAPTSGPPSPPSPPSAILPSTVTPFEKALELVRAKVMTLSYGEYGRQLARYYHPENDVIPIILENYLVNSILSKDFFFQVPPLAYYKMAFFYAISIVFALGYCIETDQTINQQIMLQAICDVENIFYQEWFYLHGTALLAEYGETRMMRNSIALVQF